MGKAKSFSEQWDPLRDLLIEMAVDPDMQGEVEKISKNWERLLKCEKLARELSPVEREPICINMEIVGL